MPRLVLRTPLPGLPPEIPLSGAGLRLGREADNDRVLDVASVSRHHAVLHAAPEGWWFEDLGSANGTFLNGTRMAKGWLSPGDRLRLGDAEYVLQGDGAPASPPVPQPPGLPPPPPPTSAPQPRPAAPPAKRGRGCLWTCGCLALGFVLLALLALAGWVAWARPDWLRDALGSLRSTSPDRAAGLASTAAAPASPSTGQHGPVPGDLRLRPLDRLPAPLPGGLVALGAWEVGGGRPERLEEAVVLEFPYDPARLPAGADPEQHLALAHFDPDRGRWVLAAAKADPARRVLRTRTRHLSTWSAFYIGLGWRVHRSRRFNVVFDPSETIVFQKVTGKAGLVSAWDYAGILGRSLDISLSRYETAGFRMPEGDSEEDGRVWTFLGKASAYWGAPVVESQWNPCSGNLLFPSNYDDYRQADHDAAHELFHKIQNRYLNMKSMDWRRWWIEATADYAAARIALQQGGLDTTMGTAIKPRYLEKSLTYSIKDDDGKKPQSFHDYATCHFVDYLVKQGADFRAMWDASANPSWGDLADAVDPLDKYLRGRFGTSRGLDSFYRDFAQFYLFEPGSPMPRLKTGYFEEVPSQRLSLAAGQRTGRLEGEAEPLHSAQVFAVRAEAEKDRATRKVQVSQVPGTGEGLITSAFKVRPGGSKVSSTFLAVLGLKAAVADLAPGEMIIAVACNGTSRARSLALEVKDLSPDLPKADPPPPPPASKGARLEICVYVRARYDRGYHGKGAAWSASRWADFSLHYNQGGIPVAGSGSLRGSRSTRGYEDTVEGTATAGKVERLTWKAVRRYGKIEERWEIELKDIPREPDLNQMGPGGTTYMIRAVDEEGKKFPLVAAHADIKSHTITFLEDGTVMTLEDVNWYGVDLGNRGAVFDASPSNQRPFIYVQVWR